jgi:ubiquinone/menaquinone biosynthesis C-methylase UbiE
MAETWRKTWHSDVGTAMALVYFKRATGELPEMESSKAAAARLKPHLRANDKLLDVGCGAGHYLRSVKNAITVPFTYRGIDATPTFVDFAKKAFAGDATVSFQQGDIFSLPFEDRSFDVVMSNNLLLHLPSIEKPIQELCRVARRRVLIRTLIGERSFRVQEVIEGEDGLERFHPDGEPAEFNFYSVYGKPYVERILRSIPGVKSFKLETDTDFDPARIEASVAEFEGHPSATRMLGEWQRNGYILQPWTFIHIEIGH